MVFKDYMKSLPNEQQDKIKELAEKTMTSVQTVYRWINGSIVPPPLKQQIIAEHLGIPVSELFPKK